MSLRNVLMRVLTEYPVESTRALADNVLAQFIRGEGSDTVANGIIPSQPGLKVQGSPGQGNWAAVPWIAVFYPVVTISATHGYYVVYLFNIRARTVCLSLNQGTTAVRKEFGDKLALQVLRERASLIRSRLSDYARFFVCEPIELGSAGMLPKGYEAGHAFGRTYSLHNMPSDNDLLADLIRLCEGYLALQFRGGLEPSIEENLNGTDLLDRPSDTTVEERKRYRTHQRIERNARAAKLAKQGRPLSCEACGFDFGSQYGELGQGFICSSHDLI